MFEFELKILRDVEKVSKGRWSKLEVDQPVYICGYLVVQFTLIHKCQDTGPYCFPDVPKRKITDLYMNDTV